MANSKAVNEVFHSQSPSNVIYGTTPITEHDIYLFKEGSHFNLYDKLGARLAVVDGVKGTHFSVWAPNADRVYVLGDFNGWNRSSHPLSVRWDSSGIWEGFIPGISKGALYKYFIVSKNGHCVEKQDPLALFNEVAPRTASIVWDLDYQWQDAQWMRSRGERNSLNAPMSIYEVHIGSWRRNMEENCRSFTYRELAHALADYVKEMGFTHVELMPIMEYPFYGSWGYQITGYFSPTSRYGTPQDFMYFMDHMHQNGIGVILDWVPSHFPADAHGLAYFDGTNLYEHADPKEGFHPDWKSCIFNYGRNEVREFLISSGLFWLDKYHADGIRVDAVASMLYRDYSRPAGEWVPNYQGGRENLEAISFLKRFNEIAYEKFPDVQTIAEESTAWTGVSRPVFQGGLGFGMKWNMGWMHDTLVYMSKDPAYRTYHHNDLTFSFMYAFTENFILSISHDEVVHGKQSLASKMTGDDWQKLANLRLLLGYMYAHPGKKLLFMGTEFAQWSEWNHEYSLDWHLLQWDRHLGIQKWVKDLNALYKKEKALFEDDFTGNGFEWLDLSDYQQSVLAFIRKGRNPRDQILVVANFTPVQRDNYRLGVPEAGFWKEILNSDGEFYGGCNKGNQGGRASSEISSHGRPHSIELTLPALGILFLKK